MLQDNDNCGDFQCRISIASSNVVHLLKHMNCSFGTTVTGPFFEVSSRPLDQIHQEKCTFDSLRFV